MLKRFHSLYSWLINLFDPPPLQSMTTAQKVGRVLILSCTLVIGSIVVAMFGAVGLFLMEKGRELGSTPEFFDGLGIIAVGILVNGACLMVLIHMKHADHKLIPPKEQADTDSQIQGK
jgi:uncharacterized membrane protein YidH (DUF202 family)